jgi:hypothetical protein
MSESTSAKSAIFDDKAIITFNKKEYISAFLIVKSTFSQNRRQI